MYQLSHDEKLAKRARLAEESSPEIRHAVAPSHLDFAKQLLETDPTMEPEILALKIFVQFKHTYSGTQVAKALIKAGWVSKVMRKKQILLWSVYSLIQFLGTPMYGLHISLCLAIRVIYKSKNVSKNEEEAPKVPK